MRTWMQYEKNRVSNSIPIRRKSLILCIPLMNFRVFRKELNMNKKSGEPRSGAGPDLPSSGKRIELLS